MKLVLVVFIEFYNLMQSYDTLKITVNSNKIVSKLNSRSLDFSFCLYFLLKVKVAGNEVIDRQ